MTSQLPPSSFTAAFVARLESVQQQQAKDNQQPAAEIPQYDASNPDDLRCLVQRSTARAFTLGTGASIFTQTLLPAILSARHEVILVTCYWAPSKTLTELGRTLEELAKKRQSQQTETPLRIHICLSSRSLFQKLFHTSSPQGYQYPPTAWPSKLGLPSADVLAAGNIDLQVKSMFFLPFSVMHPKFLVVDRRTAFVFSCNVSWEPWLEGCIELRRTPEGVDDAVDGLLEFYRRVWDKDYAFDRESPDEAIESDPPVTSGLSEVSSISSPAHVTASLSPAITETTWLPSSHHRNPRFQMLPWLTAHPPPATPLNVGLQQLFEMAQRDIYIQTPNLTSDPAITAILAALKRGVNVTITTSRNMMVWEQLLTAGTTTAWCVRRLIARYVEASSRNAPDPQSNTNISADLEAQLCSPGKLSIAYFHPQHGLSAEEEPVQSHLKLTVVDAEFIVLGSGNMDRASWYTSQELGVLLHSSALAKTVRETVDQVLRGRLDILFESDPR